MDLFRVFLYQIWKGDKMLEEEKLLSGSLFNPLHPELIAIKRVAHNLCIRYNQTYEDDIEQRNKIIAKLFKKSGENIYLQGPINFNYGCHTTIGSHFFANYNLTVLDDALVTIGNHVMLGPNVTIATPIHPLVSEERKSMTDEEGNKFSPCYAKPTVLGDNIWVAAGVIICAGVTIGKDTVIGAGSVVTKNIPNGVLAAGNPCKVIRNIGHGDSMKNII